MLPLSGRTVRSKSPRSGLWLPRGAGLVVPGGGGPGVQLTAYGETVMADAPVAFWTLDEAEGAPAFIDVVSGLTAAIVGNLTLGQASLLASEPTRKAITVPGVNGHAQLTNTAWWPSNPFSFEAWIRPDTLSGIDCLFGRVDTGSAANSSWIVRRSTTTMQLLRSNGSAFSATGNITVASGVVYHIVYTHDNVAGGNGYRNGVDMGAYAGSPVIAGSVPIRIGAYSGAAPSGEWFGAIDNIAVYDYVLPAARVLAHYDAGLAA